MRRKHSLVPFGIFAVFAAVVFLLLRIPFFSNSSWRISAPLVTFFFKQFHSFDSSAVTRLREENSSLMEKLVDEKKLMQENNALQDQFAHTSIEVSRLLPAHVIGAPGFVPGISQPEYLVIDKGGRDGIHVGGIVVYKDNAVGTIIKETDTVSQVQLLTNTASSITVETMNTKAIGIVKGLGGGEFLLDNVVLSDTLKEQDIVLTYDSQTPGRTGFPPGLIVGKITSTQKTPSALFQRARLEPLFDSKNLSIVFIME